MRNGGRGSLGKEDECSWKRAVGRHMLQRGVKKAQKLHNLFYPPVRKECMMKEGHKKGR